MPSGDLLITVNRIYVTCEAPTLGQTQSLTALDASLTPTVPAAGFMQESGTNDSLTVTPTVLDTESADITIGNVEVGSGIFHMVAVPSGDTAPSGAQIQAGTDASDVEADWSDSRSVLNNDDVTIEAYGLGTSSWKVYVAHESIDETLGTVAISSAFTPADVTAPEVTSVIGTPGADYTEATIATVTFNTDTGEGSADMVLTQSDTAPTSTQVGNGQDENGAAADVIPASLTITEQGPQTFTMFVDATTTYYPYVIQTDAAGNVSDVASAPVSFTTPSATIVKRFFDSGNADDASYTNCTATGSQADPDSGTDAVLIESAAGVTGNVIVAVGGVTLGNGVNVITFTAKDIAKTSAARWVRARSLGFSVTHTAHFDLTNGATGSASNTSNLAISSAGSGFYTCSFEIDATGDADLSGTMYFYLAQSDGGITIPSGSAGDEAISMYDGFIEVKINSLPAESPTLGALVVDAPTAGVA